MLDSGFIEIGKTIFLVSEYEIFHETFLYYVWLASYCLQFYAGLTSNCLKFYTKLKQILKTFIMKIKCSLCQWYGKRSNLNRYISLLMVLRWMD